MTDSIAIVSPPRHVLASQSWVLFKWLVKCEEEVHVNQRVAVLRCETTGAKVDAVAPRSGTLSRVVVQEGSNIKPQEDGCNISIAEISFCPHDIVHAGLCAVCGADISNCHYADLIPTENQRLPVPYNAHTLSITRDEAESAGSASCANLLRSRRLSLVLDLDHTLVHATDDPRAAAIRDFSPPGVDSHSIRSFSLGPPARSKSRSNSPTCSMHVKLRPHLKEFLQRMSKLFELSIYTMGSRPYADQIVRIIDPDNSLFNQRVTSREDFKEGTMNQKNISRLFPYDDSMVLIVDDREDVWLDENGQIFMPNLLKAKPYCFWNGFSEAYDRASSIGELESKVVAATEAMEVDSTGAIVAPIDPLSSYPPEPENGNLLAIEVDLDLRNVESEDGLAVSADIGIDNATNGTSEQVTNNGTHELNPHTAPNVSELSRDAVDDAFSTEMTALSQEWWDRDRMSDWNGHLTRLSDLLTQIHEAFFAKVEVENVLMQLRTTEGGRNIVNPPPLHLATNVKTILADIRYRIFEDCVFTFTGVFSTDTIPEETAEWKAAVRHGAKCSRQFTSGITTHVIASPERGASTEKSKKAVLENTAYCVSDLWLLDSFCSVERLPELRYTIHPPCDVTDWKEFRKEVDMCRAKKYATLMSKRGYGDENEVVSKKRKFNAKGSRLAGGNILPDSHTNGNGNGNEYRAAFQERSGVENSDNAAHDTIEQPVAGCILTGEDEIDDVLQSLI